MAPSATTNGTKSSHPDADVHPHATGPASTLVKSHTSPAPHILYSGWFCPFVQRSWIVLEERHIPYQYIEINPYHKDPKFLKLNPRGLVPTLGCPVSSGSSTKGAAKSGTEGDDTLRKPLIESNVICEYLDGLPSAQGPTLFATDAYERARQKIWIEFVGSRILGTYHRLLQHTPDKSFTLESAKLDLRAHLKTWISEANSEEGPFWAGKEFSMVDVVLAPWAVRMWVFEEFKGVTDLVPKEGEGGEDEALWTRWREWFDAVVKRESVVKTLSERQYYLPIYKRYAEDRAQSEMAKATRGDHKAST